MSNKKLDKHENIYIHVPKDTFYGVVYMILGVIPFISIFCMEHRTFDEIPDIMLSEYIFILLGSFTFLAIGSALALIGGMLLFDNEQKDL